MKSLKDSWDMRWTGDLKKSVHNFYQTIAWISPPNQPLYTNATELAGKEEISPDTARKWLSQLKKAELVEYLGVGERRYEIYCGKNSHLMKRRERVIPEIGSEMRSGEHTGDPSNDPLNDPQNRISGAQPKPSKATPPTPPERHRSQILDLRDPSLELPREREDLSRLARARDGASPPLGVADFAPHAQEAEKTEGEEASPSGGEGSLPLSVSDPHYSDPLFADWYTPKDGGNV